MEHNENVLQNNRKKRKIGLNSIEVTLLVLGAVLFSIGGFYVTGIIFPEDKGMEVVNNDAIVDVIKNSELNTFRTPYKGVVTVYDKKKTEKVDYHVSYEGIVTAGINFEEIKIDINKSKKEVTITLPEVIVKEPNVNESTLKYIFVDSKANTSTVSADAFKACIDDINKEVSNNNEIQELAKDNAKNIVEGLVKPLMKKLGKNYKLIIK